MMVRLRALQSFVGLEGRIRRGTVFFATPARAEFLTRGTESGMVLAVRVDQPASSAEPSATVAGVGPSQIAIARPTVPAPTEPVHVGGGWYEWNGKRYRGRTAADAARRGAP
jgi:hypothetical protein